MRSCATRIGAEVARASDATGQTTKTHNGFHGLPAIAFNPADPAVMYLALALESLD
jgi:hypothetical protein